MTEKEFYIDFMVRGRNKSVKRWSAVRYKLMSSYLPNYPASQKPFVERGCRLSAS